MYGNVAGLVDGTDVDGTDVNGTDVDGIDVEVGVGAVTDVLRAA